jgi:hypothetical protein
VAGRNPTNGITNREQRAIVREAMKAGCEVTITRSQHVRIETPQGPYWTGLTGSSRNAHRILRRELIKRGVPLK